MTWLPRSRSNRLPERGAPGGQLRRNHGRKQRIAALAVALSGAAAAADPLVCADATLSVVAASVDMADRTCRIASEAKAVITACGLVQSRPVRIELVSALEHASRACLGSYDCDAGLVRVVAPGQLVEAVGGVPPYALLPEDVLFRALLTHELAHALLEQSSPGVALSLADHEYVAAVMELETMAPDWRAVYIAAAPVGLPPRVGLISGVIYGFEPRKFAVNAWRFFRAEPDGCARIRDIAAGRFSFADPPL